MGRGSERPSIDEQRESERRLATRHFACFPVHIESGEGRKRTAVIRDLSVTGTLLLTRAVLSVGDVVNLSLYLTADTTHPVTATGRVVRFEPRARDLTSIWPNSVAVQFEAPLDAHEEAIRRVAEHQASLGLKPVDSSTMPAAGEAKDAGGEGERSPTSRDQG